MILEKVVRDIQNVNGYIGLAILDRLGDIVYIDENSKSADLAFSSSIFNDTFRRLNEASLDIGFSNLFRLESESEDGMVFLIYKSSINSIFAIFNSQGNISLAKIVLTKSLKEGS
jgi:hypothetical protein